MRKKKQELKDILTFYAVQFIEDKRARSDLSEDEKICLNQPTFKSSYT